MIALVLHSDLQGLLHSCVVVTGAMWSPLYQVQWLQCRHEGPVCTGEMKAAPACRQGLLHSCMVASSSVQ